MLLVGAGGAGPIGPNHLLPLWPMHAAIRMAIRPPTMSRGPTTGGRALNRSGMFCVRCREAWSAALAHGAARGTTEGILRVATYAASICNRPTGAVAQVGAGSWATRRLL